MKVTSRLILSILSGLVSIVAGILIVTNQNVFITIVIICSGAVALINGLYTLINVPRWKFEKTTRNLAIIKGIILTVFGVVAIVYPLSTGKAIASALIYIYAVGLVFSAVVAIENAVVLRGTVFPVGHFIWEAVVCLLVSIVLFTNAETVIHGAVIIVGICAILFGVVTIVAGILTKKNSKTA